MATNPQIRIIDLRLETSIISTAVNEFVAIESSTEGGRRISIPTLLSGGQTLFVPLPGSSPDANAGVAGASTDNAVVRYDGTRGLIQNSGATLDDSGVFTAVGYTSTSSERYKEDIKPITNALKLVDALEGVKFTWKEDRLNGGKRDVGLIAEHVNNVVPEVVIKNKDQIESIDYGKLVAVLINAVKELKAEVEALKK